MSRKKSFEGQAFFTHFQNWVQVIWTSGGNLEGLIVDEVAYQWLLDNLGSKWRDGKIVTDFGPLTVEVKEHFYMKDIGKHDYN